MIIITIIIYCYFLIYSLIYKCRCFYLGQRTLVSEMYMISTRLKPDHSGLIGKGVPFQRIRRVTGYLVGTLDRFNDGKRAEESQRVKHLHLS